MKLAPVLAKYLAENKKLHLKGLGTFHAEGFYNPDADHGKKSVPALNVNFEQNKPIAFDDDLIDYISKETGKMKVLAESDLTSQIEGATDFLNTGKPYFINGIGSLVRKADGSIEFHQEKFQHTERKKPEPLTEKNTIPNAYTDGVSKGRKTKSAIIILTICILAIAATILFYVKNTEKDNKDIEDVTAENNTVTDTTATVAKHAADTNAAKPLVSAAIPGFYKYILEITQQPRASKRYSQLKKINWPVEMQTTDSLNYTLFIKLPAVNADTTRIKDSLSALSGKKVWIAN